MAVMSQTVIFVGNKVFGKRKETKKSDTQFAEEEEILRKHNHEAKREHDLVLFGATGFTGQLAAHYLAKNYGQVKTAGFKWALAGRRREALEALRRELVEVNPRSASELAKLPIIIADSGDFASLCRLASSTKVVITTAGPFDKYGSDLVLCCAEFGTGYCDITGETDWVRKMVDMYDDKARSTGARIVNQCGHDCVPWDLLVMECSKLLKAKGDSITEIRCYDEINGHVSGGTLDTILHSLSNRIKYKSASGFDPLLKTADGTKSDTVFRSKNASFLGYSHENSSWTGPFVMAAVSRRTSTYNFFMA